MPDFTMCRNEDCPVKNKCYRVTAKPDDMAQSYQVFYPFTDEQGYFVDCDFFKPLPKKNIIPGN